MGWSAQVQLGQDEDEDEGEDQGMVRSGLWSHVYIIT